jgi:hypothetical protein
MARPLLLAAALTALVGCGGNDPVVEPENAASAREIEASVNRAENVAEAAKEQAGQSN